MLERENTDITIYDSHNKVITAVPITADSKRVVKLMEEDYIQLVFSLDTAAHFPIGAYCDDELFGRFYVTEEQMPKYNTTTGGYDYELKMEAWYRAWKRKKFMMVDSDGTQSVRRDVTWTLTNTLKEQMREFLVNLQLCGYISAEHDFRVGDASLNIFLDISDHYVPKAKSAQVMTYNGTNLLDALSSLADTWECEWWVTGSEGDFLIHFGKCSSGGEAIPLEIGENVEQMNINRDKTEYGNKLYIYGGTTNIPVGYRKLLQAKVTDIATVLKDDKTITMYQLGDRKFTNEMFVYSTQKDILTGIIDQDVEVDVTNVNISPVLKKNIIDVSDGYYVGNIPEGGETAFSRQEFMLYAPNTTVNADEGKLVMRFGKAKGMVSAEGRDTLRLRLSISIIMQQETKNGWYDMQPFGDFTEEYEVQTYQISEDSTSYFFNLDGEEYTLHYTPSPSIPEDLGSGNMRIIARVMATVTSTKTVFLYGDTWKAHISLYNQIRIQGAEADKGINFSWKHGGVGYAGQLVFAPCGVKLGTVMQNTGQLHPLAKYYYWFARSGINEGVEFPNLAVGDIVTLDDSGAVNVPSAYFAGDLDDPSSLRRISENRLRLPRKRIERGDWVLTEHGYIILKSHESSPNATDITELSVINDDIYPDGKLSVKEIITEQKESKTEYEGESEKATWDFTQYHLHLQTLNGKPFSFNKKYRLDNEKLELRFLVPEDTLGSSTPMTSEEYPDNFRLSGMVFETVFNAKIDIDRYGTGSSQSIVTSEQDFCLVRNDDYNALLPNDLLRPMVGDPCVLMGWNVKAMPALGLVDDAEERLAEMAFEYLESLSEGCFTFECEMMSDFLFKLYGGNVNLASNEPALLEEQQGKLLKVINGYTAFSLPELGLEVCIRHQALASDKHTRVIGMELKMDKPYDSPVLTCGETEAYSRLKQIEKNLTILSR